MLSCLRISRRRRLDLLNKKKLQDLVKDFKSEFKLTTVGEETELQMKVLEDAYKARKEMAEKEQMSTLELDTAYEKPRQIYYSKRRINVIRFVLSNGLLSMRDEYDLEMAQLKKQHDEGLISEEEYQKLKTR